jgi:hypothetical protein
MDGRAVGRCLNDLETVLQRDLVPELRGLASRAA